jgi:nicotinamidase-related amidase
MSTRIKRALIICDMQPDIMPSLFAHPSPPPSVDPKARREAFADAVQTVFLAAISSPLAADNSLVLFTGLRFPSGYEGLYPEHSLYGSLRRLNQKVGDKMAHWFMENYPGSEIDSSLMDLVKGREDLNYEVLWRTGHLPPSDLMQQLKKHSITDATVVGAKASQTVQSTVQYIAEHCPSIDLSVVEEAIADDRQDRLDAITQHLLPLYARVATIEEYTDATCGSEKLALALEEYSHKKRQNVKYYVDCERGGHYSLYIHHLTHRQSLGSNGTSWVKYPRQKWYEDVFCGKQYHCPLGKR